MRSLSDCVISLDDITDAVPVVAVIIKILMTRGNESWTVYKDTMKKLVVCKTQWPGRVLRISYGDKITTLAMSHSYGRIGTLTFEVKPSNRLSQNLPQLTARLSRL